MIFSVVCVLKCLLDSSSSSLLGDLMENLISNTTMSIMILKNVKNIHQCMRAIQLVY